MSVPPVYEEDDHSESAISKPQSTHTYSPSHSSHTAATSISAGSAVSHSAPWSQINTRLLQEQVPIYWQTQWPSPALTFDALDRQSYLSQHIAEPLATIESTLRISVPNSSKPTFYSAQSSPPLPLPWAVASSATTHSPRPTSNGFENTPSTSKCVADFTPELVYCGQCNTGFSGAYRRSNLKRHVKQKHTESKGGPYTCAASGCYRVFARPDARLKHARNHHPGLYPDPVYRKPGYEKEPATPQFLPLSSPGSVNGSGRKRRGSHKDPPLTRPTMDMIPTSCSDYYKTNSLFSRPTAHIATQQAASIVRSSTMDTQGSSTTASSLDFNVGQWLHSTPQTSVGEDSIVFEDQQKLQREDTSSIEVEELPRTARIVFASLHAKLDAPTYSQLCDTTFRRWEAIMQKLRDEQSESYPVYAKVIKDLYSVVHAIDAGAIDSANLDHTMSGFRVCRPFQNQQNGSEGTGRSHIGLGIGVGSSSNSNSKSNQRKILSSNGSGPNVKITKDRSKKSESKAVNCPKYMRWSMLTRTSTPKPCRGCRETLMAQVRSHLNRVNHRDFTIAKQCPVCKKDFIDRKAHEDHTKAGNCQHVAQSRNDIVLPWARLYLTMYPNDTRIPNPFCDEPPSWLPDSILVECRSSMSLSSTSFLGQQSPGLSTSLAPAAPITSTPVDQSSYNAALNFVLQDVVAPVHDRLNSAEATVLAGRVSRLNAVDPQVGPAGPAANDVENFIRTLRGISSRYFRMLAVAPRFLTVEEFRQTYIEAEMLLQHTREYQRRQTREAQAAPPPSTPVVTATMYTQMPVTPLMDTTIPPSPGQYMDPAYNTQVHRQVSPATSHEQYSAIGMSTHPSSQGFGTGSSQYHASYQTGPSSAHDPTDLMLLSPSQSENPWTPQTALEVPPFCPRWSGPRSPQGGTIDPYLLGSPSDDYNARAEEFRRRFS